MKEVQNYLSDEELIQPGNPLIVDTTYDLENTSIGSQTFENLDDLTGSLSQQVFDDITTGSFFDYKNFDKTLQTKIYNGDDWEDYDIKELPNGNYMITLPISNFKVEVAGVQFAVGCLHL